MKNRISFIALLLALSIFVLGCGLSTKEKSSLRCINRYMEAYEIFDYIEMYQCYPPYTQDKGESITDTFGEMVGIANGFDIGMNLPSNFAAAVMNDSDIEVKYKYKEILESEFDGSVGYLEVIYRLIIKCDGKKEKLDIVAPFYMVKEKNKWYIAQPLEIYEYKEDDFKKSAKKDKYDFSDHSAAYEIEDNLYDFYSIVSDSLGESDKAIKLDSRNKNESGIKGNASDKIHSMVDSFFITINSMTTLKDSEASEKVINIQDDVIEHFEPVADTPTVSLESETEEVSNEKVNEAINDEKESEILIDTDDLTGNTQTVNKVNLVDIKASSSLDGFGVENLTDGDIKTTWTEDESGYGIGTSILFTFQDSVFDEFRIVNGYPKYEEKYYKNGRIKELDVEIDLENGEKISQKGVLFDDENMGFQGYQFNNEGQKIRYIKLTIKDVYEGSKYEDTCIAEIKFGSGDEIQQNSKQLEDIDEYIIFESSTRYISKVDLEGLSKQQVRIARNEIFARYGYSFNSSDLKEYFASKSWYKKNSSCNKDNPPELNDYEEANARTIKDYEEDMGWD